MKYIASYVPIGTGIIDTLALDDDLNPVRALKLKFVKPEKEDVDESDIQKEFERRPGAFDRNALIQLMTY